MPPICLKTGQPADHWVRCPLAISFADRQLHSLAEAIPGLTLVFRFLNQMEFLEVGLSDQVYRQRQRVQFQGAVLGIVSTVLTIPALAFAIYLAPSEAGAITFTAAMCIGPTAAFFGIAMISHTKLIYVKKVTPNHIWFTGPLPNVLDQFPGTAEESPRSSQAALILPADLPLFDGLGIWRSGVHLVLNKQASFSAICVRTGGIANERFRIRHSFCGSHQTLAFGLADEHYRIWKRNLTWLWCGLALFLVGLLLAAFCGWRDQSGATVGVFTNPWLETGFGAGIWMMFGGMIIALVFWGKSRILTVKKITADHVWIIGFAPQVLAMFPEWPRA